MEYKSNCLKSVNDYLSKKDDQPVTEEVALLRAAKYDVEAWEEMYETQCTEMGRLHSELSGAGLRKWAVEQAVKCRDVGPDPLTGTMSVPVDTIAFAKQILDFVNPPQVAPPTN